jgi:hypothetical protein
VGAVGKIGKAIFCSNAVPVTSKKTLCCLAQEAEVFEFEKSTSNRVFVGANCLCRRPAGAMHLAVVEIVIP